MVVVVMIVVVVVKVQVCNLLSEILKTENLEKPNLLIFEVCFYCMEVCVEVFLFNLSQYVCVCVCVCVESYFMF